MRYWSGWLALVLVGVTPVMTVQAQSFNFAEDEVKVATRSYKRGEYDKSLAILNKVLATDATNTDALNLRAATNYKLKNFEGSLNDYSAIIKLDEKNTRALGGRGVVYYEQGNLARAEADYTKAIEINKDQQMAVPALFFERSKVYQRQGKVDEAVNDLTIITKIMP
jgi:tetratricopeptide (TPR) repeat protein